MWHNNWSRSALYNKNRKLLEVNYGKRNFEEKKVSKAYMKLSLPLVLSMTVSLIYNLADTFFVAQTQNTNIVAGVSLCAPLFTTLMALGNIFGQGGSSLISRLLGKNDTTATRRVSAFCFWGAILDWRSDGLYHASFPHAAALRHRRK